MRGFRLRGLEMTRLETFIDAAFAFAITLLVISNGQMPDNVETLLGAFRNVPVFAASIAVLGIFWRGHWLWSRRFGLEDGISIFISWGMIATILIYVYPLKMIFAGMFYYLSGHRYGSTITVRTIAQVRSLFAVYAVGFSVLAFGVLLLNLRAWHLREPLRLNKREQMMTRYEVYGWSLPTLTGLISLLAAYTLPVPYLEWSGWIFFTLALSVPLHRWWRRKQIRQAQLQPEIEPVDEGSGR